MFGHHPNANQNGNNNAAAAGQQQANPVAGNAPVAAEPANTQTALPSVTISVLRR